VRSLQIARATAKYAVLTLAILYALDWTVFELRLSHGNGLGSVPVEQYLSTALKGDKAEYDYLGTANEKCSRSLFPQHAFSSWNSPCWWLQRHPTQWM